ncbi:MAG: UDP-N-acetylglucosamine 2-epimerase (non-hydrolyzing) [Bacteroidales bacterium]|nr:UDP-N-acetylglucosamine 2-epimerase (non-hydrolyzing) [Bacteroidales bacterium]
MKKVMLVFGTRPEAIKMAPLVKALQGDSEYFKTVVCVTGQHREMLDQVLEIFHIKPDYDLNIMKSGQDLYDITTRVLQGMKDVLATEKPDMVLVHGDTTTSSAAALAAFYQKIPVGHVEAGLRTYNVYSPWPEEMNRQLTARIATWHFAPTQQNKENLIREGIPVGKIVVTGNTVIDALHWVLEDQGVEWRGNTADRPLVLITCHRRENIGLGFVNVCNAILHLCKKYPHVDFFYPMHPNPVLRKTIEDAFGSVSHVKNLYLVNPLGYLDFVKMMARSTLILSDSGGIQEEAPGLGKPVLVLRNTTERPEAVVAGTVKLVGTDFNAIVDETSSLLDDSEKYRTMSHKSNPYGDGHACERMVKTLKDVL